VCYKRCDNKDLVAHIVFSGKILFLIDGVSELQGGQCLRPDGEEGDAEVSWRFHRSAKIFALSKCHKGDSGKRNMVGKFFKVL